MRWRKEMNILQFLMICGSYTVFGQDKTNDSTLLDRQPYFVTHHILPSDSLFLRDVQILKDYGNFDDVDAELLKGATLKEIISGQAAKGKPATYRTVIDFMKEFKTTEGYQEFVSGVLLYKKLENKKVNIEEWGSDQLLFVKMGFSQNDLDDFKEFISGPLHRDMTYKEAYLQYIKEFEKLGTTEPGKDK